MLEEKMRKIIYTQKYHLCLIICVYDVFSIMFGVCWDDHENMRIEHALSTPVLRTR